MFYALDEEDLPVWADEAEEKQTYFCWECRGPVRKKRAGRRRMPHFYHIRTSKSCRLYSKSEDHMVAQVALQKLLPEGETVLEKPFVGLLRVADLVWEPKRIVFEIQCSKITAYEVEKRVKDYKNEGYDVVWILDDRLFNQWKLRPAEPELRRHSCYFATLRKTVGFYDQFEILVEGRRIHRGRKLPVQLSAPRKMPNILFDEKNFPSQVLIKKPFFFAGDLVHKATVPELKPSMQNMRALEIQLPKQRQARGGFWKRFVVRPLDRLLLELLKRVTK